MDRKVNPYQNTKEVKEAVAHRYKMRAKAYSDAALLLDMDKSGDGIERSERINIANELRQMARTTHHHAMAFLSLEGNPNGS